MRRRDFITLVGGTAAAAAWPLVARAQSGGRVKRIGWLVSVGPDEQDSMQQTVRRAFDQEMARLGWTDGRNVRVDARAAPGDDSRLRAHAAELVAQAPDVIVVNGTQATGILHGATTTIPIVFASVADPVASGFVANMARPGGNVTGFALAEYSLAGKWLSILKEIAPSVARVMVLYYPANSNWTGYVPVLEAGARSAGVSISAIPVNTSDEIAPHVEAFAREPAGGMIVLPSGLMGINRDRIAALAIRHRLPAVYPYRYYTANGGLVSYGADYADLYRHAAGYVDRILRGEKPGDLPVQTPINFELVINLKTAKVMGLAVPPTLRALATEVIE
jgi:putative ABC transport system substrate-binding protein